MASSRPRGRQLRALCMPGIDSASRAVDGATPPVHPADSRIRLVGLDVDNSAALSLPNAVRPDLKEPTILRQVWDAISLGYTMGIASRWEVGFVTGFVTGRGLQDFLREVPVFEERDFRRLTLAVTEMGGIIHYPRLGVTLFAHFDPQANRIVYRDHPPFVIDAEARGRWGEDLRAQGINPDTVFYNDTQIAIAVPGYYDLNEADRPAAAERTRIMVAAAMDQMRDASGRRLSETMKIIENAVSINVGPRGVTKMAGLLQVADDLGIPMTQTLSFGDSGSDWTDFQAITGVPAAVANAAPQLKEHARFVASANNSAGVLEGLRWLCKAHVFHPAIEKLAAGTRWERMIHGRIVSALIRIGAAVNRQVDGQPVFPLATDYRPPLGDDGHVVPVRGHGRSPGHALGKYPAPRGHLLADGYSGVVERGLG